MNRTAFILVILFGTYAIIKRKAIIEQHADTQAKIFHYHYNQKIMRQAPYFVSFLGFIFIVFGIAGLLGFVTSER